MTSPPDRRDGRPALLPAPANRGQGANRGLDPVPREPMILRLPSKIAQCPRNKWAEPIQPPVIDIADVSKKEAAHAPECFRTTSLLAPTRPSNGLARPNTAAFKLLNFTFYCTVYAPRFTRSDQSLALIIKFYHRVNLNTYLKRNEIRSLLKPP